MRPIALQFGAGRIGRGLFAPLFTRAGLEVLFVEARPELVASLHHHRACWIEWVDGGREVIAPVDALHTSQQEAVAAACAQATLIATAVGVNALPSVAPLLASGLRQRAEMGRLPCNILLGENELHADRVLGDALQSDLSDRSDILKQVGLVRCVVGRQVVAELPGDPPGVRADRYDRLLIDADAIQGEMPSIEGIHAVRPFEAYFLRKLYVHNGLHALDGVPRLPEGLCTTIQQALQDGEIYAPCSSEQPPRWSAPCSNRFPSTQSNITRRSPICWHAFSIRGWMTPSHGWRATPCASCDPKIGWWVHIAYFLPTRGGRASRSGAPSSPRWTTITPTMPNRDSCRNGYNNTGAIGFLKHGANSIRDSWAR
jgi:hypothetical protein